MERKQSSNKSKESSRIGTFFKDLQVDFIKNIESWVIQIINVLYLILLIWPTFTTVNKPGCDVEVVGYVIIFRILLLIAFLFFGIRLRHISYENKGNAIWVLVMSLFAMVVTVCASYGFNWIICIEFIATVPMLGVAIWIIIKYHKVVKDY